MALLLTLLACSDYRLHGEKDVAEPEDTAGTGTPDVDSTATGPGTCDWTAIPTGAPVDESCAHVPASGPLDAAVEWSVDTLLPFPEYDEVLVAPVVGDLTGDGVPDVVVVTDDDGAEENPHGLLRMFSGDDGEALLTVQVALWGDLQVFPYRYGGLALGDVDGDGAPDIVGIAAIVGGDGTAPPDPDTGQGTPPDEVPVRPAAPPSEESGGCYAACWNADGTVKWVATGAPLSCAGHAPALADLEGDGTVEVLVGASIVEGADGTARATGDEGVGAYAAFSEVGEMSFASDLDGDGIQEVVAGRTLYDPDGNVICDAGGDDGFGAAADFDGDGVGEVVLVGNGTMRVYDAACVERASWPLVGSGSGGPPTVADFDADGVPEIGAASAEAYAVYEADGTVRWSMPVTDASSYTTGSSVFDFDGDGQAEVVYADETTLWVFDGATGAVRLADDRHSSRTLHEYPVIVDVDADGQAEIVVPNGGGHHEDGAYGLYVLGSASGAWLADRPVWNQHAYDIVHVDDDLGVPAAPMSNWPTWNDFRSGDVDPVSAGRAPDAVPLAGVCTVGCGDGELIVGVRVGNGGMAPLRAGVPVSVYYDGDNTPIATLWTSAVIEPGGASALQEVVVDAATADLQGLRVVADDDGTGGERARECHEDGDDVVLEGPFCE